MPASSLTREQQQVLNRIVRIGRQVGASPKEIKAAVQTGLVETGLRNLDHGDADSQGWRQERRSLYPDPMNLDASIRRFFDETRSVKGKYGRAGALAAAVQRPAAQYRGRYEERSAEAESLLGKLSGQPAGRAQRQGSAATTRRVGAVDNSAARGALIAAFLQGGDPRFTMGTSAQGLESRDPIQLAMGLRGLKDAPGRLVTTPGRRPDAPAPSGSPGKPSGKYGPLLELFWQGEGGINVKNGQRVPQGFVSGHQGHVHVGADPSTAVRLGLLARRMGLTVGENEYFTGSHPTGGHASKSHHYVRGRTKLGKRAGGAIDVTGDPGKLRAYAHEVARIYGFKP